MAHPFGGGEIEVLSGPAQAEDQPTGPVLRYDFFQPPAEGAPRDGRGKVEAGPAGEVGIGLWQEQHPLALGQPCLYQANELGEVGGGGLLQVQDHPRKAPAAALSQNLSCPRPGVGGGGEVRAGPYQHQPALGLGRERGLGQPALAVQLPGHEGQGQAKGPGRLQVLGRGEQELPRGRMCHRKEPPCPLVSVRV